MKHMIARMACCAGLAIVFGWGATTATAGTGGCPGDSNGDGVVTVQDLIEVVLNFGECPDGTACVGDLNGDGVVDVDDLLLVVMNFGPCPGTPACTDPTDCDDGDPCTIDICFQGACVHIPSPAPGCD